MERQNEHRNLRFVARKLAKSANNTSPLAIRDRIRGRSIDPDQIDPEKMSWIDLPGKA
jgi:hypothetical protein